MVIHCAIIGDIEADIRDDSLRPGGSAAIAIALARRGVRITLRSFVGTDERGTALLTTLAQHGVSTALIDRADASGTITATSSADNALAIRQPGAAMHKGARMDIYDLFDHDVLILDAADQPLRRFLSDLPAHTAPAVRMLGTLRHLDWREPSDDELAIAMRFDTVVGTSAQLAALTGTATPLDRIRDAMPGTHLRAVVAVLADAVEVVDREGRRRVAVRDADRRLPDIVAETAILMARHAPISFAECGTLA